LGFGPLGGRVRCVGDAGAGAEVQVPAAFRVVAGEEGADADREVRVTGVGVEIPDRAPRAGSEMLR